VALGVFAALPIVQSTHYACPNEQPHVGDIPPRTASLRVDAVSIWTWGT
jgi:hypothetical protein